MRTRRIYREIHTPYAGESPGLERQDLDCEEAPSSSWTCEGPIHGPRGCSALRCYLRCFHRHRRRLHRLRRHCVSIGLRSSLHSGGKRSIDQHREGWKREENIFVFTEITWQGYGKKLGTDVVGRSRYQRQSKVGRLIRSVHRPSHLRVHVPREHTPTHLDRVPWVLYS